MMESGNNTLRQDDFYAMHSVIVEFQYGLDELDELHKLESDLTEIVDKKKLGVMDGHEIAMDNSHGSLYLYGRNAEELFKCIHPKLQQKEWMNGAVAHLRFGPATQDDVPEISIHV